MIDSLFVLAVLAINVAASEWLARRTVLRHLGSALLVIALTAIVANLGIIPTYSADMPVYSGVFRYVGPLAIFLLLLQVRLRGLARAGLPMIGLFLLGSVATIVGVVTGMWLIDGPKSFGELHHALAGMFVGTYTGGSINFNAIALSYGVAENGLLYSGAAAVDSAMTTVWMAVTIAVPRLLRGLFRGGAPVPAASDRAPIDENPDTETVGPADLAGVAALGLLAVFAAGRISGWLDTAFGVGVPEILVVTTIALGLAQLPAVERLRGVRLSGWVAVLFFLAVIGALCDLSSLRGIGTLGRNLMVFVTVLVGVHGTIVFGVAVALRLDPDVAAVASQANIGGGTSALALARSLRRGDLALPAILVGSLGNAIGTYLGFLVAEGLR